MVQVDPFAVLPEGERDCLSRAYPDLEDRKAALSVARNAGEWRTALAPCGLTEREEATLAAYLSRISPQQAGGSAWMPCHRMAVIWPRPDVSPVMCRLPAV